MPEKLVNQSASDRVAVYISRQITRIQIGFVNIMNKVFGKMSPVKLKTFLFGFCLVWGGYSFFLAFSFWLSPGENDFNQQPDSLIKPNYFNQSGEPLMDDGLVISAEEIEKLEAFNKYMDSLKLNKSYLFDSILQARPGLMDSARMLEQIIISQKK